jgi:hypothetical protein
MLAIDIRIRRTCLAMLFALAVGANACNGSIGNPEPVDRGGPGTVGGGGPTNVDPGTITVPPMPLDTMTAFTATAKAKNLLTGFAVTDDEVSQVVQRGPAALQELISSWLKNDPFQSAVAGKMLVFFRNMFQQVGFIPTEDFKLQLLTNGGFDFNTRDLGDDAYLRLVSNLQDSFAMTAWQLVKEGKPFTDTLTTNRFVMTTALKSLYVQIEMPPDAPRNNQTPSPAWTIDFSGTPIPLETALATMTFSDEMPLTTTTDTGNCRGTGLVATGQYYGTTVLFQRLLGFTKRFPPTGTSMCDDHPSKPYFTDEDVTRWEWVTIVPKADPADRVPAIQPYDLPRLRQATELTLSLPRVGFYTTPAFLALWNTNDSNQHRVTANQALLVALGQAFTAENSITPFTSAGLDGDHAVAGSECVGCHATLDPMRQFWANQFDYNDRNDFQPSTRNNPGNPRPTARVNEFAFGNFRATGSTTGELGTYLSQVTDGSGLPRFAIAVTQQLCFYANSSPCSETDTEFRRVASAFQSSSYNFAVLLKEFFASPLVTGAGATTSYPEGVPVSISRRDHLCAALSNRLGRADLCAQATIRPSNAQRTTAGIAVSVANDAFSRGVESPVTPADPTMFYRSATEMLCENIANQVVDAADAAATIYSSTDVPGSISRMVETLMGYTPSHPRFAEAVQIVTEHHDAVFAQITNRSQKAPTALRSAFALACESPRALGIGL